MNKIHVIAALEKFASNGIRALILIYLIKNFHLNRAEALEKVAAILALNYLLPFLVGVVIDQVSSLRNDIRKVSALLSLGVLAPIFGGSFLIDVSIASMLVITSVIRPMVPILIRESITDKLEEGAAFSKMYVAFNVGTLLGTILVAVGGELYGWNLSFIFTSGVLMAASLLIPGKAKSQTSKLSYLYMAFLVFIVWVMLHVPWVFSSLILICTVPGIYFLAKTFFDAKLNRPALHFLDYFFVIASFCIFFAIYEQSATSFSAIAIAKIAEMKNNFPVTALQMFDPALNILLGIGFVWLWTRPNYKSLSSNAHLRFGLGFLLMIPGLFILGSSAVNENPLLFILLFVVSTVLFVTSEQLIIPSGFAETTRVANLGKKTTVLGVWYLSIAHSENLAAFIGKYLVGASHDAEKMATNYNDGIFVLVGISAAVGLAHFIWYFVTRKLKVA